MHVFDRVNGRRFHDCFLLRLHSAQETSGRVV